VAFAFGLTVLTMAYAIGHVSGCHLNPAVTVGLTAGRRFPASKIGPYVVAQIVGAIVGATVLYLIASGTPGFDAAKGFAANGYGAHSPGHYGLLSCFVTEVIMTMMFLFIIMGSTHGKAPVGFALIATIPLASGTPVPVEEPSTASKADSCQLWSSCIAEQSLQSHAARDGCEAIEFAEATQLVASIS
jgi:glycerol uptake facilitator-like aquaporin